MNLQEKYKQAEKYAKQLGFHVWINYDTFVAEHRPTGVEVRADIKYGSQYTVEISWPSAGMPRPTNAQVKKHIEMVQKGLKVKEKLRRN